MVDKDPIRVIIVDDQAVVRSGLGAFLMAFDELELVGEARNGEEALRLCEQTQPDVALMDLKMPGMDGAQTTRLIRQRWPHIQVLALTSFKEKELVQGALKAGAMGYLLKDVSAEKLAEAIRAVHAGRLTLAPEAAETLVLADKLERLARALLNAPPEATPLPDLLAEHLPEIFPDCQVEIRLEEGPRWELLAGTACAPPAAWNWLRGTPEAQSFLPGSPLPWGGEQPAGAGLILAPVWTGEPRQSAGGIFLRRARDPQAVDNLLPAVDALAEQIGSVRNRARAYARALAEQKIAQELALAGQIQNSLLPASPPQLTGWQIAALLEPARETSGDFYDFIPLPGGRWGIVIADVTDKGLGAALFMAMSRTLLRTFAAEYPAAPERVCAAVNRRILSDSQAGLFVTAFYGILDPASGELCYANAGHNPPYLLRGGQAGGVEELRGTGTVLGILEDMAWEQHTVQVEPGDTLLLYTDGITETQAPDGRFFDSHGLLAAAGECLGHPASKVQVALLDAVHAFSGRTAPADDITLIVITREIGY